MCVTWDLTVVLAKLRWQPKYLGLEQLIKHALALESRFKDHALHLVYVWWEPANPDTLPGLREHRAEVRELVDRLGDSRPQLHAVTSATIR
jgi:hypothetical protein